MADTYTQESDSHAMKMSSMYHCLEILHTSSVYHCLEILHLILSVFLTEHAKEVNWSSPDPPITATSLAATDSLTGSPWVSIHGTEVPRRQ